VHTFTNGGMTLRWFRDTFCQIEMQAQELGLGDAYDMIGREVEQIPAGSDGLVMLPHLAGSNAPDVNAKAKGVWFGFTLQHSRAHFMRAVMESLGYIVRRNLESLGDMGLQVQEIRSLGGGSKSAVWNQIKADICQIPLETVNSVEAASLGAAILAGKATGVFQDLSQAVDQMVKVRKRTQPNRENRQVYQEGYEMYQKLFRELEGCFEKTI
ncbi:MAG: xylulokinase, partial [Blautia sp.]